MSKVHGQIPLASGTATIGADGLPTAISATFDLTNFGTGNVNRRRGSARPLLRGREVSDHHVRRALGEGQATAFTLTGDLTIHGVTKTVNIATTLDATAVPKGKKHFAYSGTTTFDRRDFGMTSARCSNGT